MLLRAMVIWVAGGLTAVPYATYYLFYQAPREQYAWLITFILFWLFGYWSVVGPVMAALKVRAVFRTLEAARSRDELIAALHSPDAREAAIDFIASENHIPRFLARRAYELLVRAAASAPRQRAT